MGCRRFRTCPVRGSRLPHARRCNACLLATEPLDDTSLITASLWWSTEGDIDLAGANNHYGLRFFRFSVLAAVAVLAPVGGIASAAADQRPARPSVVFLLADQWRAQATGYAGDPNGIEISPLVTVRVQNLTFSPLMLFGGNVSLPDFSYSLTMEDANGNSSN